MKVKKEGKPLIYAPELKIAIAREYLTGNLGYGRLAVKYGLKAGHVVREFVNWYKVNYPEPELPADSTDHAISISNAGELASLRKELQQANLKVAGLEMLMKIAQKELGVDIPKKFGTKQSPK